MPPRFNVATSVSEWTNEREEPGQLVVGPALIAVPRHADKRQPYKEGHLVVWATERNVFTPSCEPETIPHCFKVAASVGERTIARFFKVATSVSEWMVSHSLSS